MVQDWDRRVGISCGIGTTTSGTGTRFKNGPTTSGIGTSSGDAVDSKIDWDQWMSQVLLGPTSAGILKCEWDKRLHLQVGLGQAQVGLGQGSRIGQLQVGLGHLGTSGCLKFNWDRRVLEFSSAIGTDEWCEFSSAIGTSDYIYKVQELANYKWDWDIKWQCDRQQVRLGPVDVSSAIGTDKFWNFQVESTRIRCSFAFVVHSYMYTHHI